MHTTFAAIVLAVAPAFAGELASPAAAGVPTYAVTLAKSKPGDYLKLRHTQTTGGQTQTLVAWNELLAYADAVASMRIVYTNRTWTPLEPLKEQPSDSVQVGEGPAAAGGTPLDFALPEGVTLVSDAVTRLPDERVHVGPRTFDCQVWERRTTLSVPQGSADFVNRAWWSADVPISGLVRSESRATGLQESTTILELVAFSGMNDPALVKVDDALWFLRQADSTITDTTQDRDRVLERYADACLALDRFDLATETRDRIGSNVYAETVTSSLRCFAAVDGRPGQRESVGLAGDEVAGFAGSFARSYSNALGSISDADFEKLLERVNTADVKDELLGGRFSRLLLDGDRERAKTALARLSTDEARCRTIGGLAYEAGRLKRIDVVEYAAVLFPPAAARTSYLGSLYPLLEEVGREREAREVSKKYVAAIAALPDEERETTAMSVLSLALFRPWSRVEPFVANDVGAIGDEGDPEAELAKRRADGSFNGSVWTYAERAASRGDVEAAKRILASQSDMKSHDVRSVAFALHEAGKEAEAVELAKSIAAGQGELPFHAEGSRALLYLQFAASACYAGDKEAEDRWIDAAVVSGTAAQVGMAEHNKQTGAGLYWGGGLSYRTNAPPFLVGRQLVLRGERERSLLYAHSLPTIAPQSNVVEDLWKYIGIEAGKRGDAATALHVVGELAKRVDSNRRNWITRDIARSFAVGGDVASGRKFVDAIEEETLRDLATMAFVVQLALERKLEAAESVFQPWIVGEEPRQWADAKVALSLANAVAGKFERARDLFVAPRFTCDFGGMAGLERLDLLVSIGLHAARAKSDLVELGRWIVQIPDDTERALVAIGMAMGLGKRPAQDDYVDRLEMLEL